MRPSIYFPDAASGRPAPTPAPTTTRRRIVAAMASGVVVSSASASAPTPARGPGNPQLERVDRVGAFECYIRMRGALDSRLVVDLVEGELFGIVKGQAPRPLFGLAGVGVARYRREADDRVSVRSRYLGILTDLATGRMLEYFDNPYTGKRNTVQVNAYAPGTVGLTPEGTDYGASDRAPRTSPRLVTRTDRWLHVRERIFSNPASVPQPDFDNITYSALADEALDAKRAAASCTYVYTVVEQWRPWLEMGDAPGMILKHVRGTKLEAADQLPAWLLREAEQRWGRRIDQSLD